MKSRTKVVNILGGPGVGKSTIATGVYSKLMTERVSTELASEYAKDITWEGAHVLFENQIHLFSEQYRRQYRLLDKVDYVICDSPLLLNSVYLDYFMKKSKKKYFDDEYLYLQKQFFNETFDQFNNINFYIERDDKYHTSAGRVHDLKESKQIDEEIKDLLMVYDPEYYICRGSTIDVIHAISTHILGDVSL